MSTRVPGVPAIPQLNPELRDWLHLVRVRLNETVGAGSSPGFTTNLSSLADNDILQYDSSNSWWENIAIATFTASLDHGGLGGLNDDDHGAVYPNFGDTETITGAWTFDRDPSAPFVVTASSAVVTNLDSDYLDGQHGAYYLARANHTGVDLTNEVEVPEIGTATYDSLEDFINNTTSSGAIATPSITDNGDGTINVGASYGYLRATNSDIAQLLAVDLSAQNNLSLTTEALNYIYADYNGGSPQYAATTDLTTLDHNTNYVVAVMWAESNHIHDLSAGQYLDHFEHSLYFYLFEQYGLQRTSGMVTTETGTLNLAVTAGVGYYALLRFTTAAVDTSGADTFTYYYRDGLGGWTEVTSQSAIDDTNWDDGTGALNDLTANRYGVHWVFLTPDGDVYVVYGQGDYLLSQAEAATVPSSLPGELTNFGILIAKIIVQKSAGTFYSVTYPWMGDIAASVATDHGGLAGLTDDDHTQYLLAAGTRALTGNWDAGSFSITAADLIADTNATALLLGDGTNVAVYADFADGGTPRTRIGYNGNHALIEASSGHGFVVNTNGSTQGLYVDTSQVLWIGSTADTNLYRSASNTLKTDDDFIVAGSTFRVDGGIIYTDDIQEDDAGSGVTIDSVLLKDGAGTFVSTTPILLDPTGGTGDVTFGVSNQQLTITSTVDGGANVSAVFNTTGVTLNAGLYVDTIGEITPAAGVIIDGVRIKDSKVEFDTGGSYDTNLYRSAANNLKTDDSFTVGGGTLNLGGTSSSVYWAAGGSQVFAGDGTNLYIGSVTAGGNVVLQAGGKNYYPSTDEDVSLGLAAYAFSNIYGHDIHCDIVNELHAGSGVTADGVLLKDGNVELTKGGLYDDSPFVTGLNLSSGTNNCAVGAGAGGQTFIYSNNTLAATFLTDQNWVIPNGKYIYSPDSGATNRGLIILFSDDVYVGNSTLDTIIRGATNQIQGNTTLASSASLRLDGGVLYTDDIQEDDAGSGVTIDSVLLKDGNVGFPAAARGVYNSGGNNLDVTVSGGGSLTTGANILLYGGAHADAYDIAIRGDTTNRLYYDHSGTLWTFADGATIEIDHINEAAAAHGVAIDSVLLKDGGIVCADGATLEVDTINEATAAAGVTIDTLLLKDGNIVFQAASRGLYSSADTQDVTISGGSGLTTGALLQLFGATHASTASDFAFKASGTNRLYWDESTSKLTLQKAGDVYFEIDTVGGTNNDSILQFVENTTDRADIRWAGDDNQLEINSTTGDIELNSVDTFRVEMNTPAYAPLVDNGAISANFNIDLDDGNVQFFNVTGSGDYSVTLAGQREGDVCTAIIRNGSGGALGSWTWDSEIKWTTGSAPTLPGNGDAIVVTLVVINTSTPETIGVASDNQATIGDT